MTQPTSLRPDILIIGGGIAGSGLATVLARAGFGVTVIERTPVFRDRIRGESIHPWGAREMEATGLLDVAIRRAEAQVLPYWTKYSDRQPGEPYRWSGDFPDVLGELSVQHPRLQQALLDQAAESGATVLRPAWVDEIAWPDGRPQVTLSTPDQTYALQPRLLVGADGQHSLTRRYLGGKGVTDPAHHAIGGALLSGLRLPENSAHQAFYEGGFAMVFPQVGDTSRVYYVCSTAEADAQRTSEQPESLIERLSAIFPAGAVNGVESRGPLGFFPNAETVATVTHGPHTVLIGDAAGLNDPTQGHGLSLVFRDIRDLSGRLLDEAQWAAIPASFADARTCDYNVLRAHARWVAPLSTDIGPEIAKLREQVARAREQDPTAGGFAGIFATGPTGLVADEAARRHFLGEVLQSD